MATIRPSLGMNQGVKVAAQLSKPAAPKHPPRLLIGDLKGEIRRRVTKDKPRGMERAQQPFIFNEADGPGKRRKVDLCERGDTEHAGQNTAEGADCVSNQFGLRQRDAGPPAWQLRGEV